MSVIQVKNLKKYFKETKAVDGISFDVAKGEIVGFLGPNGAGKTTTIRCMMDFLRPDSGEIEIMGRNTQDHNEELKKDIGYLSGEVGLYEGWTGKEHVDFVKKIQGKGDYASELISELDLDTKKKAGKLSTGNKQKLGLILALMQKPKILILDEPTTGLDPLLQESIYRVLRSELTNGTTVFMSSHNLAEVERLCDRVVIIKDGKIVSIETLSELRKKRLYTIHVYFEGKVPKKDLQKNGMEVSRDLGDGVVLTVKGDISAALEKLNTFDLRDIEVRHSSLEDMFLEFYK